MSRVSLNFITRKIDVESLLNDMSEKNTSDGGDIIGESKVIDP